MKLSQFLLLVFLTPIAFGQNVEKKMYNAF